MDEEKPQCQGCPETACGAREKKPEETDAQFRDRQALETNLCRIRWKVLVLSGKGGVGKSTLAVNLAVSLRLRGLEVGLLDADIHGPSVPVLLGLQESLPNRGDGRIPPARFEGLKVMSIGFLLPNQTDAVIWRGPMKMAAIRQFLRDVEWGDLDVLVVDCPPGTGDEPLSVIQTLKDADGALVVTTPQDLSLTDVKKSISFCRRLNLPVLGVIENMSGFACPGCGEVSEIFGAGGGRKMAEAMAVPFLGTIPIDPAMVKAGDEGKPFITQAPEAAAAKALTAIAERVREGLEKENPPEKRDAGRN
ncbi:MAG: P-loop NTPase [Planctomycetota bacterium]|jgi:Mrp family chromosome partitioning ATPase